MTHPHEIEEREYRDGPVLWDADPDVCCAAFQLGACPHTEGEDHEDRTALFQEGRDSAYYEQWARPDRTCPSHTGHRVHGEAGVHVECDTCFQRFEDPEDTGGLPRHDRYEPF